jgi:hypothetical protein
VRYRGALTSHANFQPFGPARIQAFHEMIGTGNVATDRFPKHENQRAEYPITCGRAGHRDRSDAAQIGGSRSRWVAVRHRRGDWRRCGRPAPPDGCVGFALSHAGRESGLLRDC